MTPIHESLKSANQYYITRSCYSNNERHTIINGEFETHISNLPWKLLEFLMDNPNRLLSYEEIGRYVYAPIYRIEDRQNITRIRNRLKKYFLTVNVTETEFEDVFRTEASTGFYFKPYSPIRSTLETATSMIKDTGMSEHELTDIIECMLFQGLSGRMGRETLFALAKQGNSYAAMEIGDLYLHGYITRNHKADYAKACEWYARANNHPCALWTLGYCIMNNYYPVVHESEIDYKKALDYFNKAQSVKTLSGGSPEALTSIGQLWEDGHYPADDFEITHRCLPKNKKKAMEYYVQADTMGYHYATNRIALDHEKMGRYEKAFECFKRSAEMVPDGYVLNKLGLMYENGIGCQRDVIKACEHYIGAVESVLEDDVTDWAMFNAGRVYAGRLDGQPLSYFNLQKAFDLFNEALRGLSVEKHDQVLIEMLNILLMTDVSSLTDQEVRRRKDETREWAEAYLSAENTSQEIRENPNTSIIRTRIKRL